MPYTPPDPGVPWTETKVEQALIKAWGERPRSPYAADLMNALAVMVEPSEAEALQLRAFSFVREKYTEATFPDLLRRYRLHRSTYEERWRRALRRFTHRLNLSQGRVRDRGDCCGVCENDNLAIDTRKSGAGQIHP